MTIKHFEEIDLNNLSDYYSKEIKLNGNTVNVDLNFDSATLTESDVNNLNNVFNLLQDLLKNSLTWIQQDLRTGVDVQEYINFHLEDFFEEEPEEILVGTDKSLSNQDRFLQTLHVSRIGIYPSTKDNYVVMDYMTNEDLSNYILVINVKSDLNLNYITIES
ncbi:MAG: DUF2004 domain-containing protein [Flavobacteriales bacterium]|nr:DUF2004 domain-containing protein [Flavobacteriales bacterium]